MAALPSQRTGLILLESSGRHTARLYQSGRVWPFVGSVSQGGRRCWLRTQGVSALLKETYVARSRELTWSGSRSE